MLYLETFHGFVPWTGQPINDVLHPREIEQRWTAAELAAIGLYSPAPGEEVPEGYRILNSTVARVEGEVRFVYDIEPVLPTLDDLYGERDRRLAEGFDYDFGDARGVHRIRTSIADMIGWDEVSKFASALLALGQTTQPITIATGTGVTQVTPVEWQMVMLAAAAFRQPIWGASFILENMNPIPADFRNDAYWEIANAPA